MPFDFVFSLPPASMTPSPVAPGNALAPAQAIDTSTGVGYYSAGTGWLPQVPATVQVTNLTGQNANIGSTTLYTVPAHFGAAVGGLFQVSAYIVSTNTPTSATLPSVQITWTDADTATAEAPTAQITSTGSVSSAGVENSGSVIISPKAGTAIKFVTASYAGGSGTALVYAVRLRAVYLG